VTRMPATTRRSPSSVHSTDHKAGNELTTMMEDDGKMDKEPEDEEPKRKVEQGEKEEDEGEEETTPSKCL